MNNTDRFDYEVRTIILYAGGFGTSEKRNEILKNADVKALRKALELVLENHSVFYKKAFAISQITQAIQNKAPYPIELKEVVNY